MADKISEANRSARDQERRITGATAIDADLCTFRSLC
jgi:hypothetical protein